MVGTSYQFSGWGFSLFVSIPERDLVWLGPHCQLLENQNLEVSIPERDLVWLGHRAAIQGFAELDVSIPERDLVWLGRSIPCTEGLHIAGFNP